MTASHEDLIVAQSCVLKAYAHLSSTYLAYANGVDRDQLKRAREDARDLLATLGAIHKDLDCQCGSHACSKADDQ